MLKALLLAAAPAPAFSAPAVSTLIGTGSPGQSDRQETNPCGLAIGPDRALYFCDLDNPRIRRIDRRSRRTMTVAGHGGVLYVADSEAHRIRMVT